MAKKIEKWGEEIVEFSPHTTGPIVFHFRPTKYVRVTPDRLSDWEEFFAENVGLRAQLTHKWTGDPHETVSGSGDGWDDCDYS